jgi:[protein-PII] uridylyltransferase
MTIVEKRPSSFLETGDAATFLAERTAYVDQLVGQVADLPSKGFSLLAVGGYGRRHLFPYSDIDLLLLFESERLALASKDAIAPYLQRLWDAGLRVSQSVRTPAECLEVHDSNTELNISLLDQRYLAGDRALYAELARKLPRFLQASREPLVRNLAHLARERHAKYARTFYHLEPDVKETPGGLRDYQLLCWLQQLREGSGPEPSSELADAFRYLARVRCHLHLAAKRDQNVLTFEAQDALAEHWHDSDAAHWMRGYYRHARAVFRAATRQLESTEAQSSSLFAQFRDRRSRLSNADFSVLRDRVHFRAPQQIDHRPELVLNLFEFVARHGVRPSQDAEQQIEARLPRVRERGARWQELSRILSLPHAPLAVRWMHETRVLTAIFPEMEGIECLVIRDFYHRYTVDEHTIVAMENLWSVSGAFRDVLTEIEHPAVLMFALLFHDVGKGAPSDSHVEAGVELARHAMERIHMPQPDRDIVEFLILRHLDLSTAMQSRDLFDPQTVRELAHQVETVERLKALALLTYADISAVNPNVMTAWRAEQLWQLYLIVYGELTRELESERVETATDEFLEGFPTRYLRTHSADQIKRHRALEQESRKRNGVAIDLKRLETAWQLTLVAPDRPGLFAATAGSLSSFGMNIVRAEAFANRHSQVLDTFTFEDPHRTLELNPSEIDRLRSIAERAISGKVDVRELLRNRPKPQLPSRKARITCRVSFDSDASETATLVEIVAEDRPGLLYDVASAISASGANIEVVLIDTQAHKAIDVFYVTAGGKKLTPEKQEKLEEALRGTI